MRKVIVALILAGLLALATAVPAFAGGPGPAGIGSTPANAGAAKALCGVATTHAAVTHGGTGAAGVACP